MKRIKKGDLVLKRGHWPYFKDKLGIVINQCTRSNKLPTRCAILWSDGTIDKNTRAGRSKRIEVISELV